ncbi:ATP-binding cassette domain-containing protein [Plebeiibacterium sediminum]|uniref:ATP-binding cassette domain-containing protein n=1 Tax=Plebeiibacterium sediminum TaxID=2992112 RepID=A0AAE3M9W7_9BACT|nr:ATP-binding cassette domain-containing protein [Plebeiobacterium sediminum]MCW3789265.1 ATP-binding cassette domain-containing protein [Plebeiobacterium sediminum]
MDINVNEITKLYGPQKALDNLSFKVKTGEILGFLGPNGAGKTTTMKAITCFISPNSGDITVGGVSVLQQPDKVKSNIGYLPENNPLYLDMPIMDYLKFIGELQGVKKSELDNRVKEMVLKCGLNDEKHKKIGELSKGYRQRVGLAQALIHNPEVLILDEPTTGLDPNQIIEIRELIKEIGKEKTVILSSHILAEVEATCDRVLIINKGKIVADGTPSELRHKAQGNEVLKVAINSGERNEVYEALKHISEVDVVSFANDEMTAFEVESKPQTSSCEAIFKMCAAKGWYLTQLTPIEKNLEDIFRELTGGTSAN